MSLCQGVLIDANLLLLSGTHCTPSDPLPLRFVQREFRTGPRTSLLDLYSGEFIFRALKLSGMISFNLCHFNNTTLWIY